MSDFFNARVLPQCSHLIAPLEEKIGRLKSTDKIVWSNTQLGHLKAAEKALESRKSVALHENSPWHNFSKPCTHDLLSVKALACSCDCIIKALKCLTLAAIESASISHGSHDTWCIQSQLVHTEEQH
jgi:hypothetical protein